MKTILVIDDDADVVDAIRTVLTSVPYAVETAANGEDGLRKARSLKPDLVILDVMMETIDKGFEVCRALKSGEDTGKIPVLMLTALKEVADINFNAGNAYTDQLPPDYFSDPRPVAHKPEKSLAADGFYEKPIEPAQLLREVDRLLISR
jgi:CheY-like chemotaxis protein